MMASLVVLSMFSLPSDAQNHLVKLTNHLEPYGFFRTSAIFDARQSKTDTDDLFYYLPYDKENNLEGKDIWSNPSFKLSAVTTRVGFDLKGFQYGSFNVTGKLEADFYLFNESNVGRTIGEHLQRLCRRDVANLACPTDNRVEIHFLNLAEYSYYVIRQGEVVCLNCNAEDM